MSIRVIFWGNSQSVFSSRHFMSLQRVSCDLAAVVDVPAAKQDSTNPLPDGLPNFLDVVKQEKIPSFAPENPNAPEFVKEVRGLTPDLFIAVGYALILRPAILAVPEILAVNFHASLLPLYRGKHPVFWTLRGGECWAGLTVHVMDQGIDTGDIIYQVRVPTHKDDTVALLYNRIMDQSEALVGRLIADAEEGMVPRQPQPPAEGSYFSSTKEEDFRIVWSWNAEKIRRHIQMTPGKCFGTVHGRRLAFSEVEVEQDRRTEIPGTILNIDRFRCLIAVGDGAVWIGRADIDGGIEQSLASSCRQLGLEAGTLLG